MIFLSYVQIPQPFSNREFEKYLIQLPSEMQRKILQYKRWEDSHNSLLGKILLKEMAARFFQIPDILPQLQFSKFNKPQFCTSISFNISHAGNLVVCAMSGEHQIGIDIEKICEVDLTSYQAYMSIKEWQQIELAQKPIFEFFKYWTQKEAAMKADGRGFSISLDEIEIQPSMVTISNKNWYIQEINIHPDYTCNLVTDKVIKENEIKLMSFLSLINQ